MNHLIFISPEDSPVRKLDAAYEALDRLRDLSRRLYTAGLSPEKEEEKARKLTERVVTTCSALLEVVTAEEVNIIEAETTKPKRVGYWIAELQQERRASQFIIGRSKDETIEKLRSVDGLDWRQNYNEPKSSYFCASDFYEAFRSGIRFADSVSMLRR